MYITTIEPDFDFEAKDSVSNHLNNHKFTIMFIFWWRCCDRCKQFYCKSYGVLWLMASYIIVSSLRFRLVGSECYMKVRAICFYDFSNYTNTAEYKDSDSFKILNVFPHLGSLLVLLYVRAWSLKSKNPHLTACSNTSPRYGIMSSTCLIFWTSSNMTQKDKDPSPRITGQS